MVGLLTMSAGTFLFIPAADIPSFPIFMFAPRVLAAGIISLQVSGNPQLRQMPTAVSRPGLVRVYVRFE